MAEFLRKPRPTMATFALGSFTFAFLLIEVAKRLAT